MIIIFDIIVTCFYYHLNDLICVYDYYHYQHYYYDYHFINTNTIIILTIIIILILIYDLSLFPARARASSGRGLQRSSNYAGVTTSWLHEHWSTKRWRCSANFLASLAGGRGLQKNTRINRGGHITRQQKTALEQLHSTCIQQDSGFVYKIHDSFTRFMCPLQYERFLFSIHVSCDKFIVISQYSCFFYNTHVSSSNLMICSQGSCFLYKIHVFYLKFMFSIKNQCFLLKNMFSLKKSCLHGSTREQPRATPSIPSKTSPRFRSQRICNTNMIFYHKMQGLLGLVCNIS